MFEPLINLVPEYSFDAFGKWYCCRFKHIFMISSCPITNWKVVFIEGNFTWSENKEIPEDIKKKFIEYTNSEFFEIDYKRWKNGLS